MPIFYEPGISGGACWLNEDESRHCARVLRLQSGDPITVVDGRGIYYDSLLAEVHPKKCTFNVVQKHTEPQTPYSIHLLIAPTKNTDRTEWMVEKLTETGINSIQFVRCQHSERKVLKPERLLRKAISAMKQSGRATLPNIYPLIPLMHWKGTSSANAQQFIAHLSEEPPPDISEACTPNKDYFVLVGPEGDFSPEELEWAEQQGFMPVALGANRLRTETAGLVAALSLHLINRR